MKLHLKSGKTLDIKQETANKILQVLNEEIVTSGIVFERDDAEENVLFLIKLPEIEAITKYT